jgi:hypothetical protein
MSFLQRAKEAASNAADQARQAAEQARAKATDPGTQERLRLGVQQAGQSARQAGTAAKRGMSTLVDKIDPGLLADIVIKATALQEKANAALRAKGSPYRIAEVQITATFPPQVGFAISRVGDVEEVLTGQELDSAELVSEVLAEEAAEGPSGAEGNGEMAAAANGDSPLEAPLEKGAMAGEDSILP